MTSGAWTTGMPAEATPHPGPQCDSQQALGLHLAVSDLKATDFLTHLPLLSLSLGPLFPGDTAVAAGDPLGNTNHEHTGASHCAPGTGDP